MRTSLLIHGSVLLMLGSYCSAEYSAAASAEVDSSTDEPTASSTVSSDIASASSKLAEPLFKYEPWTSGSSLDPVSSTSLSAGTTTSSESIVIASESVDPSIIGGDTSSAIEPSSVQAEPTVSASSSSSICLTTTKVPTTDIVPTSAQTSTSLSVPPSLAAHDTLSALPKSSTGPAQPTSIAPGYNIPVKTCRYDEMIKLLTDGGCIGGVTVQKVAALVDLWQATLSVMAIDDALTSPEGGSTATFDEETRTSGPPLKKANGLRLHTTNTLVTSHKTLGHPRVTSSRAALRLDPGIKKHV